MVPFFFTHETAAAERTCAGILGAPNFADMNSAGVLAIGDQLPRAVRRGSILAQDVQIAVAGQDFEVSALGLEPLVDYVLHFILPSFDRKTARPLIGLLPGMELHLHSQSKFLYLKNSSL